ncbi:hypothetical protein BH20ACT2_BH20ACT2_13780 [soil metagenome]
MVEVFVFVVSAVVILGGAVGVIVNPNPVHAALSLVATLFGIAVLFVAQEAHFLAAVQVIVYAGAIVVLFLFVIMLLGVDRSDDLDTEPIPGQRPAAGVVLLVLGAGLSALLVAGTITGARSVTGIIRDPVDSALVDPTTGAPVRQVDGVFVDEEDQPLDPPPTELEQEGTGYRYDIASGVLTDPVDGAEVGRDDEPNVNRLAEALFTDHVFAFEVTSVLLVIAVVGAVLLARRPPRGDADDADEPVGPFEENEVAG